MVDEGTPHDGGVENGARLIRFATALLGADVIELTAARDDIVAVMGGEALTDTAAVAALFNAIDRVADATGIPLEDAKAEATAEFRLALGIDEFATASEKGYFL